MRPIPAPFDPLSGHNLRHNFKFQGPRALLRDACGPGRLRKSCSSQGVTAAQRFTNSDDPFDKRDAQPVLSAMLLILVPPDFFALQIIGDAGGRIVSRSFD